MEKGAIDLSHAPTADAHYCSLSLSLGLRELWWGVAGGGGEINPARYDEVM